MIFKVIKKNDGSSLISTIVAFAILMMGIAAFTTAVVTSLKVTKNAETVRRDVQSGIEDYYLKDRSGDKAAVNGSSDEIRFVDQDNKEFILKDSQAYICESGEGDEKVSLYYFK